MTGDNRENDDAWLAAYGVTTEMPRRTKPSPGSPQVSQSGLLIDDPPVATLRSIGPQCCRFPRPDTSSRVR